MEKKLAIILAIIAFIVCSLIITRGKCATLLVVGAIGYLVYKFDR